MQQMHSNAENTVNVHYVLQHTESLHFKGVYKQNEHDLLINFMFSIYLKLMYI